MKILHLEAKHFMALGDVRLDSIDKMGLVLLQGVNKDDPSASSNGAGKSSIVDAISWCLFGETARGESGDAIVNEQAGKDCRVMLTLEDGANYYRIVRYRKDRDNKNNLRLFHIAGGHLSELTGGTTELTQTMIEKILGCTREVFNAAIYAGQEKMPDLPSMTDKALKLIVEEAAGIDRLQNAYEVARAKARDAQMVTDRCKTTVENLERAVVEDDREVAAVSGSLHSWDIEHANRVTRAQQKVDLLTAQFRVEEEAAKKATARHHELEQERKAVRVKIDGAAAQQVQRSRLQATVAAAEREFTRLKAVAGASLSALEKIKKGRTEIDDKVGTPCEGCDRPFEHSHLEGAYRAADKQIAQYSLATREAAIKARDYQPNVLAAQKALADFEASMTDVTAEVAQERALQAAQLAEERIIAAYNERNRELGRAHDELRAVQAEKNPHIAIVKRVEVRLAQRKADLEKARQERAAAEARLILCEQAAKVFSPTGVRGQILDTVTPFLNERTAHYLGVLSDGNITAQWTTLTRTAKGDAKEKFTITVENKTGAKKFGLLSGGEKRKVRLASAMALQDLVAARASKPIGIFIADEIDHALDGAGLERLMTILEEKAREKGSVIVVSHNSLRDWIRNVITVVKEGGQSRVEVETT